ncbi:MAG: hypothetical protein J5726_09540 [Treponema sp.]|nr:hypothetical protein [Treponema sp.]
MGLLTKILEKSLKKMQNFYFFRGIWRKKKGNGNYDDFLYWIAMNRNLQLITDILLFKTRGVTMARPPTGSGTATTIHLHNARWHALP